MAKLTAVVVTAAVVLLMAALAVAQSTEGQPSCASKLTECANYLNTTTTPPESCCKPLKEAVTNERACLCSIYNNKALLDTFQINITQALNLPKLCKIDTGSSSNFCKDAAGSPSSTATPSAKVEENAIVAVKLNDNGQAKVSVKLINGDGENPAQIYGRISGRFSIDQEIELFDKKQGQRISVKPGEFIPMNTPQVNVPSNANNFEIRVYLKDYDMLSSDDEVANGKATFAVKPTGKTDTIPISGEYGSVEVTVVWG